MTKRQQTFTVSTTAESTSVPVENLPRLIEDWLCDCELSGCSRQTVEVRRIMLAKFLWFLQQFNATCCGLDQVRRFFIYLNRGHEDAGGRWGNPQQKAPLRPCTIQNYHKNLSVFFKWAVGQDIIVASPMERIPKTIARTDQIQPFNQEQVQKLIQAARRSRNRRRDEALIYFLGDTGLRASEVVSLKMRDIDCQNRRCNVLGKGNKRRTVYFGRDTARILWQYLKEERREPDEPIFLADRGIQTGDPLTRNGLFQLIQRLGVAAGIEAIRCSPHTFRHTFAIEFLRRGGNTFTLKEILGHTSLHMTNRYVALAQADIENQQRRFSPMDGIGR